MANESFVIWVSEKLAANRTLKGFPGKFAIKHNHIYRIDYYVAAEGLDDIGVACDFDELKKAIRRSLADLQGSYLNDVADVIDCSPNEEGNPTAEVVARVVWRRAEAAIAELDAGLKLQEVIIAESPSGKVVYRG